MSRQYARARRATRFEAAAHRELPIGGVVYRLAPDPARPDQPLTCAGARSRVYQLVAGDERRALKVFEPGEAGAEVARQAERLAQLADLPGLAAARRQVLTPARFRALVRRDPGLAYAVLMPWIPGPTWAEVLAERRALTPAESLTLARGLAGLLAELERRGLSHGQLGGAHVVVPALADPPALGPPVELVGLEALARPDGPAGLAAPGLPGYTIAGALPRVVADRLAGAILLAEMLGWCDELVRATAWGASFFAPEEVQESGLRYRALAVALAERWGSPIAGLLARAWEGRPEQGGAPFEAWLQALQALEEPGRECSARLEASTDVDVPRLRLTLDRAGQRRRAGDRAGALADYRAALALLPPESGLARALAATVRELEAEEKSEREAADLAGMFAQGLAAYRRGDWASARALLAEIEQRRPGYAREGQSARVLLAEAERRLGAVERAPGWLGRLAARLKQRLGGGPRER